jgi:hypothetical protein
LEFAVFLFHIGRIRFVDLLALGVLFVLILAFKTAIPTAIVTGMSVILILAPTTRPLVSGNDLIFPLLIHTLIGNRIGWIELGGFEPRSSPRFRRRSRYGISSNDPHICA